MQDQADGFQPYIHDKNIRKDCQYKDFSLGISMDNFVFKKKKKLLLQKRQWC